MTEEAGEGSLVAKAMLTKLKPWNFFARGGMGMSREWCRLEVKQAKRLPPLINLIKPVS